MNLVSECEKLREIPLFRDLDTAKCKLVAMADAFGDRVEVLDHRGQRRNGEVIRAGQREGTGTVALSGQDGLRRLGS